MNFAEKKINFRICAIIFGAGLFFLSGEIFIRLNPLFYCTGYRISGNKKLVYELCPGIKIKLQKIKISRQGLNDRYFPLKKNEGVYRIAVVGDSVSFGWRVDREKSFPKILEEKLNREHPSRFEVINFSIPGYNTAQELELIKTRVRSFNPDLVILVFCNNDTHLCNYFIPKTIFSNFLYQKSYFCHFVLRRIDLLISSNFCSSSGLLKNWHNFKKYLLGMFYNKQIIYSYPGLEESRYLNMQPPQSKEEVPAEYWYMLGNENYKEHLSQINDFLRKEKVKFISSGFFLPEILEINRDLGLEYICDLNINTEKDFLLDDGHLNDKGHYLVADYLENFLKKNNVL